MKKRIAVVWAVFVCLFVLLPFVSSGIEEWDVINFSNYEKRIFAEFETQNQGRISTNPTGSPASSSTPICSP